MNKVNHTLYQFFIDNGFTEATAKYTNLVVLLLVILLFVLLIDFGLRKLLVAVISKIARSSKTHFDDLLVTNKVPRNLAHIIPLVLAFKVTPYVFTDFEPYAIYWDKGLKVCGVILILVITRSVLKTLEDFFKTIPNLKDKPIDSYIQVIMIFLWFIGGILILSVLTGKDVGTFLTTLGALSAVLLFVFKDTILGFVASVQITVNDTVRIGDWITMPGNNADGDVISISLSAVQIQNFDKTITSIPTYKLLSDAFINWRGMSDSDGRRIKRSLFIKISSIHFLEAEELVEIEKIERIKNSLY